MIFDPLKKMIAILTRVKFYIISFILIYFNYSGVIKVPIFTLWYVYEVLTKKSPIIQAKYVSQGFTT